MEGRNSVCQMQSIFLRRDANSDRFMLEARVVQNAAIIQK